MNICVDFETAKALKEAGLNHPENKLNHLFFDDDGHLHRIFGVIEWSGFYETMFVFGGRVEDGVFSPKGIDIMLFAPTALEIIDQMPAGTSITKTIDGDWVVKRAITQFYEDESFDKCPHIAAAKAFIAWKKGLE